MARGRVRKGHPQKARAACDEQQLVFDFSAPKPVRKRRVLSATDRRKFITNRKCLKCDKQHRSRWPGLCPKCKRHVDYIHWEEDYSGAA